MRNERVYISGPITGNDNAEADFEAARLFLCGDYDVVSPLLLAKNTYGNASYAELMSLDFEALKQADYIALLPGWEASKGACAEKRLADQLGLGVLIIDEEGDWFLQRNPEKDVKDRSVIRQAHTRAVLEELREQMGNLLVLHLDVTGEDLPMDDIMYNSGVRAAMQLIKDALGDTSGLRWGKRGAR